MQKGSHLLVFMSRKRSLFVVLRSLSQQRVCEIQLELKQSRVFRAALPSAAMAAVRLVELMPTCLLVTDLSFGAKAGGFAKTLTAKIDVDVHTPILPCIKLEESSFESHTLVPFIPFMYIVLLLLCT